MSQQFSVGRHRLGELTCVSSSTVGRLDALAAAMSPRLNRAPSGRSMTSTKGTVLRSRSATVVEAKERECSKLSPVKCKYEDAQSYSDVTPAQYVTGVTDG